ncbi:unnamed protein product [Schistosoma margrebowiei]|uniref:Uncharacterized protein n=1 Tax=Schistosoma margrebowiei TaxID=48269 RepID=A0A183M350_9TREM|nr:unnamed protein product [Schistosoma margrebowiei]
MESSRPKEKRKTKEHITRGNGDRHEKNEQELDGIRKGGLGQNDGVYDDDDDDDDYVVQMNDERAPKCPDTAESG